MLLCLSIFMCVHVCVWSYGSQRWMRGVFLVRLHLTFSVRVMYLPWREYWGLLDSKPTYWLTGWSLLASVCHSVLCPQASAAHRFLCEDLESSALTLKLFANLAITIPHFLLLLTFLHKWLWLLELRQNHW